jgi:hypothetical protein
MKVEEKTVTMIMIVWWIMVALVVADLFGMIQV